MIRNGQIENGKNDNVNHMNEVNMLSSQKVEFLLQVVWWTLMERLADQKCQFVRILTQCWYTYSSTPVELQRDNWNNRIEFNRQLMVCGAWTYIKIHEFVRQHLYAIRRHTKCIVNDVEARRRIRSFTYRLRHQVEIVTVHKDNGNSLESNGMNLDVYGKAYRSGKVTTLSTTVPGTGFALFAKNRVLMRLDTMMKINFGTSSYPAFWYISFSWAFMALNSCSTTNSIWPSPTPSRNIQIFSGSALLTSRYCFIALTMSSANWLLSSSPLVCGWTALKNSGDVLRFIAATSAPYDLRLSFGSWQTSKPIVSNLFERKVTIWRTLTHWNYQKWFEVSYPFTGISIIHGNPPNLQFIWMATLVATDISPRVFPPFGVMVRWTITCVGTACWTQHFFLILLYRSALLFGTTHMMSCGLSLQHRSSSCVSVVWRSSASPTLKQQ